MQRAHHTQSINLSTLTPIVQKSLQNHTIRILDWDIQQLGGGIGNPVSVGLYRIAGIGQTLNKEEIPWSIILKIVQSPANIGLKDFGEADVQTHWNYWKREPLVYQSGFLETLPQGLSAPKCYEVVEQPENIIWIWLEDIAVSVQENLSLQQYSQIAYQLGQFNGMNIDQQSFLSFPWLSRKRTRQWLSMFDTQKIPWDHPQILAHYPQPEAKAFTQMLADKDKFLNKLESLPQAVCHGDTYPTNFMARRLSNGQTEIVVLDWALTGIAPIGADLGQLVFGAQKDLKDVNHVEIDKLLFKSYLDGLKNIGCSVKHEFVRFGYAMFSAVQVGLFKLYLLNQALDENDSDNSLSIEPEIIPASFEIAMANEAHKILSQL